MSEDTVVLDIEHDHTDQVRDYVAQVRRALRDLPDDDVDELTIGMEADLYEIRAESGDLVAHLGAPAAYAHELRAAAGLPEHTGATRRRLDRLGNGLRARWATARRRHPWLVTAATYTTMLRPAWWLLRGLLAAWLLRAAVAPVSPLGVLLALVLVPLSIRAGLRGRPTSRGGGWALMAANTLLGIAGAVVAVQVGAAYLVGGGTSTDHMDAAPAPAPPGLALDGSPVGNLFVYDAAGHPVPRARVYTETGSAVRPGDTGLIVPSTGPVDVYGRTYPNTFPIPYLTTDPTDPQGVEHPTDPWHPVTDPNGDQSWTPPAIQPPLAPVGTNPSATTSPTPAPTASGATSPAPAASGTTYPTPRSAPGSVPATPDATP